MSSMFDGITDGPVVSVTRALTGMHICTVVTNPYKNSSGWYVDILD